MTKRNTKAKVIFPEVGEGEEWLSLDDLKEEYIGYAFLLKKEFKKEKLSHAHKFLKHDGSHWFWGTISQSKNIFGSVILASIMVNLFVLATPLFTMNVYDKVVPNDAIETLWVLAIGIVIVYVFDTILRLVRNYLIEIAGKKSDIIMSSKVFTQTLNLKMSAWPKSTGSFASQLREFESIRNFFTSSTIVILSDIPFAFVFLFVIYLIGGPMVAVPMVTISLILLYSLFLMKPLRQNIEATYEATAQKNSHLIESLQTIQTVKTLGVANYAQWVWEEASGMIANKSMKVRLLSSSISVVTNLFVQLNTVGLIVVGIYRIGELDLSLGG